MVEPIGPRIKRLLNAAIQYYQPFHQRIEFELAFALKLRHYLADKETLEKLLAGVIADELSFFKLVGLPYPGAAPPAEYLHVFVKGLAKDPAQRFQSAGELIALLHAILAGKVPVQCPFTASKRSYRELGRVADRHPFLGFGVLLFILATVVFSGVQLVRIVLA